MKNNFAKIIYVFAFVALMLGCKKNDGKGRFYLTLKDFTGTTLNANQATIVEATFEFNHTESEDVADILFIKKTFFTCTASNTLDSMAMPAYTSTSNDLGEFTLQFKAPNGSGNYTSPCLVSGSSNYRTDSLVYSFWLKDKNGNFSDTAYSPKIIYKRQ